MRNYAAPDPDRYNKAKAENECYKSENSSISNDSRFTILIEGYTKEPANKQRYYLLAAGEMLAEKQSPWKISKSVGQLNQKAAWIVS